MGGRRGSCDTRSVRPRSIHHGAQFAGWRRPHYSLGGIVLLVISPNSHSTLTPRALDIMSNSSTKIRRVPASISYTVGRLIPKSLAKSALLIFFDRRNE